MLAVGKRSQSLAELGVPFARYADIRHTAVKFSPLVSEKMGE